MEVKWNIEKCQIVISWVTQQFPLISSFFSVKQVPASWKVYEQNNLEEDFQFHFQHISMSSLSKLRNNFKMFQKLSGADNSDKIELTRIRKYALGWNNKRPEIRTSEILEFCEF